MTTLTASKKVVATGVALVALAALSFALSETPLGAAALPIALAIAVAKAVIVLLFFMELRSAKASAIVALGAGIVMLTLLVGFIVADVETRETPPMWPAASAAR